LNDDTESSRIQPYPGPAGGWGALQSVGRQLKKHGIPIRGLKTLLATNQPDGFDCPGCAWPDRNPGGSVQFCENGAKAVAHEATERRATPEVIARHTVTEMLSWPDQQLEALGRLTHPMRFDAATDRYVEASWDQAFAAIATQLRALKSPDEALFYTSGRTSNEAAFLYQLFAREFGTNNLPDCSNMCHEPSGVALKRVIGVGKGTVTLEDFERTDLIVSIGHNPGSNHPRMLGELRAARKRGATVMSFNPLRERGLERFTDPQDALEMATLGATEISSLYFQPRIGGDLALLQALAKRTIELDDAARAQGGMRVVDVRFIEEHTQGFDGYAAALRALPWPALVEASGLSLAQLHAAADVYVRAPSCIVAWGMGITQHRQAVATIEAIAALLMLRGHLGRLGSGVCPVRGHSNVQGDRTMGIDERPPAAFLDKLGAVFGFEPPRRHGFNTVEAIAAMRDGQAQVFFALGGNFAVATPDTPATQAALRRCTLTTHVSTTFNRSHLVHGREAWILPCLGRTERDVQAGVAQAITVEDSMSMVHRSAGRNEPASEHLLSEPVIVAKLAQATLAGTRTPWAWLVEDYDRIRDKIAAVIPGFEDFNALVSVPGGFRLPNAAAERRWNTAGGKAIFAAHPLVDAPREDGVLTLATIRSHDQYNTTIYGTRDRYRGVQGERRVVFIHRDDLQRFGLQAGERVDIETVADDGIVRRVQGFVLVDYAIPPGNIASYYPETNPLVPLHAVAEGAGTPTSKSIPVRLSRSTAAA
jgi:molybdopterin-dependent oxidoreductase alpha subunit